MDELSSQRFCTLAVMPAQLTDKDHFTDWEQISDVAMTRPDIAWILGNYAQFDGFNRNGNRFITTDKARAASRVVNTPLNLLHRKQHIIGHYVGARVIVPSEMKDAQIELEFADKALPPSEMPHDFIQSVAGMYRYHFPKLYDTIQQAHEQGALFFSMESVAEQVQCQTPACRCGNATYEYRGTTDKSYCASLNRPRAMKDLIEPWFVGGAAVIPPARPGWARADITHMVAVLGGGIDSPEAEMVYEQVVASAPHLEPKQWEFIMAMILADAHGAPRPDLGQEEFDRLFQVLISAPDLDTLEQHREALEMAAAEAEAGQMVASGLAVVAKDTGRVLMLQRALDASDPAAGTWEMPGGKMDDCEAPFECAVREWMEELGCELPDGYVTAEWTSTNGVYQGFVYVVPSESDVDCNMDHANRSVMNPDDPDGDNIEVAAWMDPDHLATRDGGAMPGMRAELAADLGWLALVKAAPDAGPISQEAAHYRPCEPEKDEDPSEADCCGNCAYFDAMNNSCSLIAGHIEAEMVCDLFCEKPEGAEPALMKSGVSYQ